MDAPPWGRRSSGWRRGGGSPGAGAAGAASERACRVRRPRQRRRRPPPAGAARPRHGASDAGAYGRRARFATTKAATRLLLTLLGQARDRDVVRERVRLLARPAERGPVDQEPVSPQTIGGDRVER